MYIFKKIKYSLSQNKLLKEVSWSLATKGVALLFYFLVNIYLARTLGVEKFGAWSFFFSIFTIILLLSNFGINASAKKYVAQYNKTNMINSVLKSSLKLRFVFSMAFALLILLVHKQLAILIGRPEFMVLFLFSVPLVLFSGFVEFLKDVFMGLHRIKYNFIINFLEHGLKLVFVVFFFAFSLELINIVNSFIIGTVVASVIGFYFLYKNFYLKNQTSERKDFTEEILRYSAPLFFICIGFIIATEVDTLMLGLLATDTEVGIYAVAKQIINKLPHLSFAIAMGSMPVFAKLNDGNREKLRKLFYKLLKINALIFFIITTSILLFSWFFVPLIFGFEYTASVLPLQILTVYLFCNSFTPFLDSFLDYQGLAKRRAINLSVAMVLNILLNLILIPLYGSVGAAVATSISYLPYVVLNYVEVKKYV